MRRDRQVEGAGECGAAPSNYWTTCRPAPKVRRRRTQGRCRQHHRTAAAAWSGMSNSPGVARPLVSLWADAAALSRKPSHSLIEGISTRPRRSRVEREGRTALAFNAFCQSLGHGDLASCRRPRAGNRSRRNGWPDATAPTATVRNNLGIRICRRVRPQRLDPGRLQYRGPAAAERNRHYWHQRRRPRVLPITPGRFRVIADLGGAAARAIRRSVARRGAGGRRHAARAASPSRSIWLSDFRINERKVADYRRGDLSRRRRRPYPQPRGRPGHEHRHAGCLQPGLEAGPVHAASAGPLCSTATRPSAAPSVRRSSTTPAA